MAKPPPGAMSSPWGENGEMSTMLKNTNYFKDAQFNTTPKQAESPQMSPFNDKQAEATAGKGFDQATKKALINLLMDNNIDAVNITDSDITFKYKGGLFKVTMV